MSILFSAVPMCYFSIHSYSIFDNECGAVATSYKSQCDGKKFIENLEDAFLQIYKILSNVK